MEDWDRTKPIHDFRYWEECAADLFKEVMLSLTPPVSGEAPITPAEKISCRYILNAATQKYDAAQGSVRKPVPNLDRVAIIDFGFSNYVQRWRERSLKSGEAFRGVSVRDNEVYVYTGAMRGIERERILVSKDTGPWNAEVREMYGEMVPYVGKTALIQDVKNNERHGRVAPNSLALVKEASKESLLHHAHPAKPSLNTPQLEQARRVVEKCRSSGKYIIPVIRI